ncbi:unnamed protein product [Phytophthora lilii]|uniref:Unnamed protein product n=1 Tax=Phytophthora lilii TaxID=2077276 RepID=A0A9W6TXI6_9STRA|nr:unnamed protein product [Phytophthora lilii]
MYPWFRNQCACSVMELNCFERGTTGNENEVKAMLQSLDSTVLNSLIISHCHGLVILEEIRRFNRLMTLELYNSTVLSLTSNASLSLPFHSFLTTVYIVWSQLIGGLPEGLTTALSPNIIDIEFVASNLGGSLPSDFDEKWPSVTMLYVEHCGL